MIHLTAYRALSNSSWALLNPEVSHESSFYHPLNSQFDVDAAIISKNLQSSYNQTATTTEYRQEVKWEFVISSSSQLGQCLASALPHINNNTIPFEKASPSHC